MINEYKKYGNEIWEKFNAPLDKKFWYYGEVLAILKEKLDNEIVKEFEQLYNHAKDLFK